MGTQQDGGTDPGAGAGGQETSSGLTAEDVKRMIAEELTGAQRRPAAGARATQRDAADDVGAQVRAEVEAIKAQEAKDAKLAGLASELAELKAKVTTAAPVTAKVPDALRAISRKMWGDPT